MRRIGLLCLGTVAAASLSGAAAAPAAAGASPYAPQPQACFPCNHNSSRSNPGPKNGLSSSSCKPWSWTPASRAGVTVTLSQSGASTSQQTNGSGIATFPYVGPGQHAMAISPADGDLGALVVGTSVLTCDDALSGNVRNCSFNIDAGTPVSVELQEWKCLSGGARKAKTTELPPKK